MFIFCVKFTTVTIFCSCYKIKQYSTFKVILLEYVFAMTSILTFNGIVYVKISFFCRNE